MNSACIACGSESSQKIKNLEKLGLPICMKPECVDKFLKLKKGALPICRYCKWFIKKNQLCPPAEYFGGWELIDLQYEKFGFFCEEFEPRDLKLGKIIMEG